MLLYKEFGDSIHSILPRSHFRLFVGTGNEKRKKVVVFIVGVIATATITFRLDLCQFLQEKIN